VPVTPAPQPVPTKIQAPPPIIEPSTYKDVAATARDGRSVTLKRSNPRSINILPSAPSSQQPVEKPTSQVETSRPVESRPKPKPADVEVLEERIVKVEEKIELSQKDVDLIEKLVNTFKKEMKDIDANLRRDLKDVERANLKNQRQIEDLKRENERFKITGSDTFSWQTGGPVTGDGESPQQTTKFNNSLSFKLLSKPDPKEELTFSATLNADTVLGARTGYSGYIEGTNGF